MREKSICSNYCCISLLSHHTPGTQYHTGSSADTSSIIFNNEQWHTREGESVQGCSGHEGYHKEYGHRGMGTKGYSTDARIQLQVWQLRMESKGCDLILSPGTWQIWSVTPSCCPSTRVRGILTLRTRAWARYRWLRSTWALRPRDTSYLRWLFSWIMKVLNFHSILACQV